MKIWRLFVLSGVPVAMALFSVVMGKDANWDFLNYRWYTPYAFLHGRLLTDVLVSEHATFYNPLLELPFYLIASHLPAIVAGFLLALAASVSFVPLCLLAEQCLQIENPRHRFAAASGIALCGLLGGGVLGQIGIVSWDLPLSTLTLFALYLLLRNDCAALQAEGGSKYLLLAGFLAGCAAGLKLTAAIYPLGMVVAIIALSGSRVRRVILFGVGGAIGMTLLGGYWMVRLQAAFGNPIFPYFNDVFHSAFALSAGNRDGTFLPHDITTALLFPFLFSANSLRVAEYHFRDVHIAMAYALIVLAGIVALVRKPFQSGFIVRPAAWFLFIFAAISFAAWEYMFAIYRYILPLELLSPLLIVLAIGCLPLPKKLAAVAAIVSLVIAQCLISTGWNRKPWDRDYVTVEMPQVPANAIILMTGNAPMGFVVPFLPAGVPVLRIGSYLAEGNAFADILRQRVSDANGPFIALFAPGDESATVQILAKYGLIGDFSSCTFMTSNVSDPLRLCPVSRK